MSDRTLAKEVNSLKWSVLFISMVAFFATGHWVAGAIMLFIQIVEAHSE